MNGAATSAALQTCLFMYVYVQLDMKQYMIYHLDKKAQGLNMFYEKKNYHVFSSYCVVVVKSVRCSGGN